MTPAPYRRAWSSIGPGAARSAWKGLDRGHRPRASEVPWEPGRRRREALANEEQDAKLIANSPLYAAPILAAPLARRLDWPTRCELMAIALEDPALRPGGRRGGAVAAGAFRSCAHPHALHKKNSGAGAADCSLSTRSSA
jgi:hypothetical protein